MNRGQIDAAAVEAEMRRPGSKLDLLRRLEGRVNLARVGRRAFHPNGGQQVLTLSPDVFAVLRSAPENDRHVLAMTNVTGRATRVTVPLRLLPDREAAWRDLLSHREWAVGAAGLTVDFQPYDTLWLEPVGPDGREAH